MANQKESILLFREYLEENEKSINTINTYICAVNMFFKQFDSVNKRNMIAFKAMLLKRCSPRTASNRCIAMNQFCDFIGNPEYKVRTIKTPKKTNVENVISIEEYRHFLESLKRDGNEKGYWTIRFLAQTGARVSELIKFEMRHLDNGVAEFWTKGKIRRILIPQNLIEESREYFERVNSKECPYLFQANGIKQYSTRGIAQNIARWGMKYQIRREVLYPHAFRHLYAIQFLKSNGNIALLADLMGHASVNTTAIYLRLSEKQQRKILDDSMDW